MTASATMLLPKYELSWKSAKAKSAPYRTLWHSVTRPRYLLIVTAALLVVMIVNELGARPHRTQRIYCWGPSKAPMDMTPLEQAKWQAHLQTPVIFNSHKPLLVNSSTIQHVDLNHVESTPEAIKNKERVLMLTPLRDAAHHLSVHFDRLTELSYPHDLIDLAFIVGDSEDDTMAMLSKELDRIQRQPKVAFHSALVVQKDFHFSLENYDVEARHGFAAQGPRRIAMAKARNYLLYTALKPYHSWVYWRDVDIEDSASTIIEDLIAHDRDIIVPNVWFHRYEIKHGRKTDIEGRFDYNSWQESEHALHLASTLPKSAIMFEGYKELKTERAHMAKMGDWRGDKDTEIELDGIGGVSIMVKANVHRSGMNFPIYAFENQAETEGFAKMAKRAGYGVYGLPNYVVWHVDTGEKPGNA